MENLHVYLALAKSLLPPDLWNKAVVALGYLSLFGQIVPALLTWGVPAATRAADAVAKLALASPLRPLIIYFAPSIVAFLDAFTAALEKVADTFKSRLEADLADATKKDAPADAPKA